MAPAAINPNRSLEVFGKQISTNDDKFVLICFCKTLSSEASPSGWEALPSGWEASPSGWEALPSGWEALAVRMGSLARNVPGRGTNFCIGLHGLPRTFLFGWISVRLGKSDQFGWICNPAVVNIRIFNPGFALFIALQMLIFKTIGLQIRPNVKSDRTGATLGVGLGATNSKYNHPDNQRVKCQMSLGNVNGLYFLFTASSLVNHLMVYFSMPSISALYSIMSRNPNQRTTRDKVRSGNVDGS